MKHILVMKTNTNVLVGALAVEGLLSLRMNSKVVTRLAALVFRGVAAYCCSTHTSVSVYQPCVARLNVKLLNKTSLT